MAKLISRKIWVIGKFFFLLETCMVSLQASKRKFYERVCCTKEWGLYSKYLQTISWNQTQCNFFNKVWKSIHFQAKKIFWWLPFDLTNSFSFFFIQRSFYFRMLWNFIHLWEIKCISYLVVPYFIFFIVKYECFPNMGYNERFILNGVPYTSKWNDETTCRHDVDWRKKHQRWFHITFALKLNNCPPKQLHFFLFLYSFTILQQFSVKTATFKFFFLKA